MVDCRFMRNILFFTFNELLASNGISKKIIYQKNALEKNGCKVHLMYIKQDDPYINLFIDDTKITSYYHNFLWTFKLISFSDIWKYIVENEIEYIYVRYTQYASFTINSLFKHLKKKNIKIVLEIPTYPYDAEFKSAKMRLFLLWERVWRKQLARNLDYIITYTQLDSIWKRPTINIRNGVDFTKIPLRSENRIIKNKVELIAVAAISFWHGYDRIIEGLNLYYQNSKGQIEVYLKIVGKGNLEIYNSLVDLVKKYNLNNYVTFCGEKYGEALDELFDAADIAIGCLGCHRKKIKEVSSLKNVEYAARGIPFIYSEINKDFDDMKYVKKISPDESPVDIQELIEWRKEICIQPKFIRDSIIDLLSWNKQMEIVLGALKQ